MHFPKLFQRYDEEGERGLSVGYLGMVLQPRKEVCIIIKY